MNALAIGALCGALAALLSALSPDAGLSNAVPDARQATTEGAPPPAPAARDRRRRARPGHGCPSEPGGAAPDPDEQALVQQAVAWDTAIVEKDRRAIAANMTPDFLHIDAGGRVSDRAGFLDHILTPRLALSPYTMEDLQVRSVGDTRLLTGTTDLRGTWDGKPFRSHYRFTDTYVRTERGWKVAHVQVTALGDD